MWFSMASTTPLSSAIFTLSCSIRTMASICGPWGSWRNISDEATIRMIVGAHELGLGDQRVHLPPGPFVAAGLQPVGVPPGQHPLQPVFVQGRLDLRQVARLQAVEETGLQRNAVDLQFGGPADEVLKGPAHARIRLVRVDFAEITVVAVAVDADFHQWPSESPRRQARTPCPETEYRRGGVPRATGNDATPASSSACGRRGP